MPFSIKRKSVLLAPAAAWALLLLLCACAFAGDDGQVAASIMPKITAPMRTYSHTRYALYFIGVIYDCILQFACMESGLSAYMRNRCERHSQNAVVQFLTYFFSYFLVLYIAMLPFSFLGGFALEHAFHLTHQTCANWILDSLKQAGLGFVLGVPITGSFFWAVRKLPRSWPLVFYAVGSCLIGIETFVSPVLLEPVLNKFTPMPPGLLKDRIEKLSATAGAAHAPIYVADKSKQTDKFNAYVSGFGQTTHIVIWDTTLNGLPSDQLLAIVAHELGHYYLHHVLIDFFIAVGVGSLTIPINYYLARPFAANLPGRWGVRGLDDYAIMPVVALVTTVAAFIADPLVNAWSRQQEHEADAFAVRVTGDGQALARSFVALSEKNLSEPDPPPFIEFWLFSHPSLKERIEFALKQSAN